MFKFNLLAIDYIVISRQSKYNNRSNHKGSKLIFCRKDTNLGVCILITNLITVLLRQNI
jgi:hypothetical protein